MTTPTRNSKILGRRRRLAASALVAGGIAAITVAAAAPAQAATYSGTLTGVPEGEITLTFDREDGRLYLDQYSWGQAPRECDNGTESIRVLGGYNPPDGLVSHRSFRIRRFAPENDFISLLSGEFNRRRTKLSGELRYRGRSSDPSLGVCDTGKLQWRATKEI